MTASKLGPIWLQQGVTARNALTLTPKLVHEMALNEYCVAAGIVSCDQKVGYRSPRS